MRRSKSLFGTDRLPIEEGYLDPISLRKKNVVDSALDDDDDQEFDDDHRSYDNHLSTVGLLGSGGENPEGAAGTGPCNGGPFSALTPSMWPAKGDKVEDEAASEVSHELHREQSRDPHIY